VDLIFIKIKLRYLVKLRKNTIVEFNILIVLLFFDDI